MKERVLHFGADATMMGILSLPESPAPGAPAVVVLNAGLVHRVGPFRMNVEIARAAAAWGFPAFRFDLTGLGDSMPRGDTLDLGERVVRDIGEGLDAVARATGCSTFVLVGLCSGAVNAHHAATSDPRVVGCVLLDAYAYPTPKYYLQRFAPKLTQPRVVVRGLKRRLVHGARRAVNWAEGGDATGQRKKPEGEGAVYLQESPPRGQIAEDLRSMLARGVRLLYVFLGEEYVNYQNQLADAFPEVDLGGGVQVEHWPDADHTCTLRGDRQRLLSTMERWLGREFPALRARA